MRAGGWSINFQWRTTHFPLSHPAPRPGPTTVTIWLRLLAFVHSIMPLKASIPYLQSSNNLSSCAYLVLGSNAVIYVKCLG